MSLKSLTQHELFQAWMSEAPKTTWKQHLETAWSQVLDRYYELSWQLIPLGIRSKRPLAGYFWTQRTIPRSKIEFYVNKSFNLAVSLGLSKLICIDYETHDIPDLMKPWLDATYSVITPRGIHFYFTDDLAGNIQSQVKSLSKKMTGPFEFRGGVQYCVLPISCVKAKAGGSPLVYRWYSMKALARFSEFKQNLRR